MISTISDLTPIKWRGLTFPVRNITTDFSHDIIQHKKPDLDGARLENTGRSPINIRATAVFRNGLAFEKKQFKEDLYPAIFKTFTQYCLDGSTGELDHPILGIVNMKCSHYDTVISADARDGQDIQVQWIETVDDRLSQLADLPIVGSFASALSSADDLDNALFALKVKNQNISLPKTSYGSLLRQISTAANSIDLLQQQIAGKIDNVKYELQRTQDSISRLASTTTTNMGLVMNNIERLRSALFSLAQTQLAQAKQIKFYVAPTEMTLGSIAGQIHSSMDDLITLNRQLFKQRSIKEGTLVKYYG